MLLSEDKISHISRMIIDSVWKEDLIDFIDEGFALRITKKVITEYLKKYDDVDEIVRKKISSQKKVIPEGSREWGILYNKYFLEEADKKKL